MSAIAGAVGAAGNGAGVGVRRAALVLAGIPYACGARTRRARGPPVSIGRGGRRTGASRRTQPWRGLLRRPALDRLGEGRLERVLHEEGAQLLVEEGHPIHRLLCTAAPLHRVGVAAAVAERVIVGVWPLAGEPDADPERAVAHARQWDVAQLEARLKLDLGRRRRRAVVCEPRRVAAHHRERASLRAPSEAPPDDKHDREGRRDVCWDLCTRGQSKSLGG